MGPGGSISKFARFEFNNYFCLLCTEISRDGWVQFGCWDEFRRGFKSSGLYRRTKPGLRGRQLQRRSTSCHGSWTWTFIVSYSGLNNVNKTGVNNDPFGQTHSLASSGHCFPLISVLFCFLWGRTDDMCENNYHYLPWQWLNMMDVQTAFLNLMITTVGRPNGSLIWFDGRYWSLISKYADW